MHAIGIPLRARTTVIGPQELTSVIARGRVADQNASKVAAVRSIALPLHLNTQELTP